MAAFPVRKMRDVPPSLSVEHGPVFSSELEKPQFRSATRMCGSCGLDEGEEPEIPADSPESTGDKSLRECSPRRVRCALLPQEYQRGHPGSCGLSPALSIRGDPTTDQPRIDAEELSDLSGGESLGDALDGQQPPTFEFFGRAFISRTRECT
jgi:hypothetical protein